MVIEKFQVKIRRRAQAKGKLTSTDYLAFCIEKLCLDATHVAVTLLLRMGEDNSLVKGRYQCRRDKNMLANPCAVRAFGAVKRLRTVCCACEPTIENTAIAAMTVATLCGTIQ